MSVCIFAFLWNRICSFTAGKKFAIMKCFQTIVLCLFLSFGLQKATAQVYKFKASSFSVLEKDAQGKWGEWSEFEKSTVVITLDGDKNRVTVASKEIQLYKIVAY